MSPKNRHLGTIAQLCRAIASQIRHLSTIGKKLVNQQYLFHMSSQYGKLGPLAAEIGPVVWGTPANFNGFRVFLASLLQRRRSTEANQTLHDVWPSPALLHYIHVYIFESSYAVTEFYEVQNARYVQVLRSAILAALLHGTSAAGVSQTAALSRGRHLYSGGRPSRWASAHILVLSIIYSYLA